MIAFKHPFKLKHPLGNCSRFILHGWPCPTHDAQRALKIWSHAAGPPPVLFHTDYWHHTPFTCSFRQQGPVTIPHWHHRLFAIPYWHHRPFSFPYWQQKPILSILNWYHRPFTIPYWQQRPFAYLHRTPFTVPYWHHRLLTIPYWQQRPLTIPFWHPKFNHNNKKGINNT